MKTVVFSVRIEESLKNQLVERYGERLKEEVVECLQGLVSGKVYTPIESEDTTLKQELKTNNQKPITLNQPPSIQDQQPPTKHQAPSSKEKKVSAPRKVLGRAMEETRVEYEGDVRSEDYDPGRNDG